MSREVKSDFGDTATVALIDETANGGTYCPTNQIQCQIGGFMNHKVITGLVRSTIATGAIVSITAFAQDTLDEIVVTAQRRAELARDVPISITSISAAVLEQTGTDQLSDIAKLTPALRFDAAGSFFQPTIRGVGTAITTSGGGPNVGIYVDGFFSPNPEVSDFQLMKLKSVQVLKGPQGTLFGRNTTGGAILVTTADPSTETSGEVKVSYGSFNAVKAQGYGTFGITDKLAMDLEGIFSRGDGFTKNTYTGNDKEGEYQNWSARAGLKAELSDSVSLLLRYTHSITDDPSSLLTNAYVDKTGEAGFLNKLPPAIANAVYGSTSSAGKALVYFFAPLAVPAGKPPYATDPDQMATPFHNSFQNKTDSGQVTVKADLGFADLTSYSQYRQDDSPNLQDLDASAVSLFDIRLIIEDTTVSQEFLLNSKPGSPLQWTAGLSYFQNRDTYVVDASFGAAPFIPYGGSSTLTKSYAGFADLTYAITPNLFLTGGARYSYDEVTDAYFKTPVVQTVNAVPDLTNDQVTPRLVLRYKPSNESSIYGSYARGYKAGILNVGGASYVPIDPETNDAFEVGYKYDDRRLSADVATYYYKYKNLQVSSFQAGTAEIRNAAEAKIWGLEGSLRYNLSDAFNVSAGAAYTHARYSSFTNAPYTTYCDPTAPATNAIACGPIGAGSLTEIVTDASNFHMQRSPDFTGNVGVSYTTSVGYGQLTLSGNLYYTSKFYFDPSQQFIQDSYTLLGLRAQWADPSQRYTVAVYGDNVTDERYRTQVLANTLGIGNTWSAPASYGLQVGAKF
jgi:iron complex outermembrane recepter protein